MTNASLPRVLFTIDCDGSRVRGTYHRPVIDRHEDDFEASAHGQTGVLIVNALASPRSGASDSAVYWAKAFASSGFPCFRVDLPGLGDTAGHLPTELITYITEGGHEPAIRSIVRKLVDRFSLSGVIVMGHCAGGITALHAASEQEVCKGLILLDPYFNTTRRVTKMYPGLVLRMRDTNLGMAVRHMYDLVREFSRTVRQDRLPQSANRPLLSKWKQIASDGLPILILRSPGFLPAPGVFDYLQYAIRSAGTGTRISVVLIPGADHSFATSSARQSVRDYAEQWLRSLSGQHIVFTPAPAEAPVPPSTNAFGLPQR